VSALAEESSTWRGSESPEESRSRHRSVIDDGVEYPMLFDVIEGVEYLTLLGGGVEMPTRLRGEIPTWRGMTKEERSRWSAARRNGDRRRRVRVCESRDACAAGAGEGGVVLGFGEGRDA
jgi:hypothetical protein